jgi:hypothetical protein
VIIILRDFRVAGMSVIRSTLIRNGWKEFIMAAETGSGSSGGGWAPPSIIGTEIGT